MNQPCPFTSHKSSVVLLEGGPNKNDYLFLFFFFFGEDYLFSHYTKRKTGGGGGRIARRSLETSKPGDENANVHAQRQLVGHRRRAVRVRRHQPVICRPTWMGFSRQASLLHYYLLLV
ncbi:hypothetical protein BS78_05G273000 [Paspalum vaginatum]|nr:hypothetical protein BS78_05G273000 [Paspalum vaginatum]